MTLPVWPAEVPGFDDKIQGEIQQGFERTPMQYGVAKQKRLFSAVSTFFRGQITMTAPQVTAFENFYFGAPPDGINQSGEFMFPDPRGTGNIKVRFEQAPTFLVEAGGDGPVSLYAISLEKLP